MIKPGEFPEVTDPRFTPEVLETLEIPQSQKLQIGTKNELATALNDEEDILSNPEFDQKFKESIREVRCAAAGKVKMIDISPENPKATIFLAPGWLETLEANKYLIKSLVELGYRVVSLHHPRKGGKSSDPKKRRVDAVQAVMHHLNGEKVFLMGHSLGAVDAAEYLDPKNNPHAHEQIHDIILTNPAGLGKNSDGFTTLLNNYVRGHMRQKKEVDSLLAEIEKSTKTNNSVQRGIPVDKKSTAIRTKMDTLGGKELGENLWLAYREAQRVANSKIQAGLGRIRSKGHQIQVFSQKDDKLLPAADYDLRVKQGPSPDPHLAQHKGIKHIDESQEGRADVDSVVSLAGYHNTPRNAVRGNPQWMSLVWIDAYINDRLAS